VAVAEVSGTELLLRKKVLELYGTEAEKLVPLSPVVIIVLELGVLEVILDVPTGLAVVQVKAVLQLLPFSAIVQLDAVSVPVVGAVQLIVFGLAGRVTQALVLGFCACAVIVWLVPLEMRPDKFIQNEQVPPVHTPAVSKSPL